MGCRFCWVFLFSGAWYDIDLLSVVVGLGLCLVF